MNLFLAATMICCAIEAVVLELAMEREKNDPESRRMTIKMGLLNSTIGAIVFFWFLWRAATGQP